MELWHVVALVGLMLSPVYAFLIWLYKFVTNHFISIAKDIGLIKGKLGIEDD